MWYDNDISKGILEKKYYHEGETTPQQFIDRVSGIYSDEIKNEVKEAIKNADFCPAGRILYGAGSKGKFKATMSNCFILPASKTDSMDGIFELARDMAKTFSYGGGVGTTISTLRPKGAKTNNSAKTSTGAVSFMNILNEVGNIVGSNGRRSATMMGLDCDHPDLYEFLHIKESDNKLASMNISILFTDKFMQAVKDNKEFRLHFYVPETDEHIENTINARDFFKEYCKVNRDYGDPGALFKDRMQKYNLLSGYSEYKVNISNPCGEYIGNDYNSCLLSSINLYNIVDNKFTNKASINYEKLEHLVRLGIDVLDETLDYGLDLLPLEPQKKCAKEWRAIGLGVFGLADMFIALGVKYGSKESLQYVSNIFDYMNIIALDESANRAKKYGTFEKYEWEYTKESPLIKALTFGHKDIYDKIRKVGLRNGTILSVAPTGSISLLMGGYSGGVEPLFKVSYERSTHSMEEKGKHFRVYAKSVKDLLKYNNMPLTLTNEEVKNRFPFIVESHDIDPNDRIAIQSIMQEYVDNAISSTVNLPKNTSEDVIFDIYMKAWEQGLKGITVFVDGCKRGNILGVEPEISNTVKQDTTNIAYNSVEPESRRNTNEVSGKTYKMRSACAEKIYVTVNKTDDGNIFEVFVNPSGGCAANVNTISRLVSMALRSGVKVDTIIDELSTAKCPACQALRRKGEKDVSLSCGNAIAEAIRRAYYDKSMDNNHILEDDGNCYSCKNKDCPNSNCDFKEDNSDGLMKCPECGEKTLRLEAKCVTCSSCGYSLCN